MKEKMKHMSPEEREAFKQELKDKWNSGGWKSFCRSMERRAQRRRVEE